MNRTNARELAFKKLFQYNIQHEIELDESLPTYTVLLIEGVQQQFEEIGKIISENLENWSFERIPYVEKTILQIATFELLFTDDIPVGVGINEAVELGHLYGDEKSAKFINGVLSKIVKTKEK